MPTPPTHVPDPTLAPIPVSFREYLRSFGPGIVVVLTWLGAGDVVGAGVSGGNYGYALMWAMLLALIMRFLFVSLIAKYQLCNQHGESVLDGLARLHPLYAPGLAIAAVVMGHLLGSFMVVGTGELSVRLFELGQKWQWSLLWSGVAAAFVFHPVYARVEVAFKVMLALLAVSFIGSAIWVGPSFTGIMKGTFAFELPQDEGKFGSLLVAISMLGAVGGSLMNLAYPYFIDQKGWRGPQYRKVQTYDFLLAIAVMIVLNLAVWTLGAELIFGTGKTINDVADLTALLAEPLGPAGRWLFLVGVFAAVFTSLIGMALIVASLASHGYLRWKAGAAPLSSDYRIHPIYRAVVLWSLISPLVWTLPGMPDFVTLTIVANSLQVVLVPFLAGGLWWITASARYIGEEYKNKWWENVVMALLFAMAIWGAVSSVKSIAGQMKSLFE
jgi:Mn2+/Fe2+ NRAMP family transporter